MVTGLLGLNMTWMTLGETTGANVTGYKYLAVMRGRFFFEISFHVLVMVTVILLHDDWNGSPPSPNKKNTAILTCLSQQ